MVEIFVANGRSIGTGLFAVNAKPRFNITSLDTIAEALVFTIGIFGTFRWQAATRVFIATVGARHNGAFV